jgi:serine/threonine protein phosphatase PrpC
MAAISNTMSNVNASNANASNDSEDTDIMPLFKMKMARIESSGSSHLQCDLTHSTTPIFYGSLCKQLDKRQDLGVHGKYENGYYIGAFDGHGTHKCIELMREFDYAKIAMNPLSIHDMIPQVGMFNSGSTMNFTTIQVEDEIIVTNYNAGDSECMIFVNGELVFESVTHSLNNPAEKIRIRPLLLDHRPTTGAWAPIPLSATRMTVHRSDIANFNTGESLVPTMALGHNNMTDFVPDIKTMRFKLTDHVRIVSGSDGFWGMIVKKLDEDKLKILHLEDLVDFVEKRWKQEWEYAGDITKPDNIERTHFPGYDDITVCIWDNMY